MKAVLFCIFVGSLCAMVVTIPASGAPPASVEKVVYAPVLRVVPTTPLRTPPIPCNTGKKPAVSAGLAAQLRWDFDIHCSTSVATRASRFTVTYSWDGRTYTQTMDRHPGDRVALQVRVR